MKNRPYSTGEEIASSVSHGVGALLGVAALVILVVLAAGQGDPWRITAFSIYGASLVLLYLASTLYHGIPYPRVRRVMRRLDHAAIHLLIAGTYTPFTLVTLRGPWGWTLFGLVWGLALGGILLETLFIGRWKLLSVLTYLLMGWLVLIALRPMFHALGGTGMMWLGLGGLCYTGGVVFYAWKSMPWSHPIWHLFVLGGSACHFFAMLLHVLPE